MMGVEVRAVLWLAYGIRLMMEDDQQLSWGDAKVHIFRACFDRRAALNNLSKVWSLGETADILKTRGHLTKPSPELVQVSGIPLLLRHAPLTSRCMRLATARRTHLHTYTPYQPPLNVSRDHAAL